MGTFSSQHLTQELFRVPGHQRRKGCLIGRCTAGLSPDSSPAVLLVVLAIINSGAYVSPCAHARVHLTAKRSSRSCVFLSFASYKKGRDYPRSSQVFLLFYTAGQGEPRTVWFRGGRRQRAGQRDSVLNGVKRP